MRPEEGEDSLNDNSAHWLERIEAGDDSAAAELFDSYARRLVSLARKRLSPAIARRVDADDIVQSAFRSFFLGAREGDFVWKRSGDLWRLLVKITMRKLHRAGERHRTEKRSVARDLPLEINGETASRELADREPTPVEVIALLEQVGLTVKQFEEPIRRALELRLSGQSHVEIGEKLNCSQRSVRRWLHEAHAQMSKAFAADTLPGRIRDSAAPDPRATLKYEDFLIEDYLGGGGMGKVYRALQRSLRRPVAIKSLRKSWLDHPRAVEHFLREGELLSQLRHEHIVGFHGIGRFPGGGYFLVLDLVEGQSLADLLRDGPLPIEQATRYYEQATEAINYAHEKGVLHGDITPANMLIDSADKLYVTDFGLGRWLHKAIDEPAAGGTSGFRPPEQLNSRTLIDKATDWQGLQAVWHAMTTGQPPYDSR